MKQRRFFPILSVTLILASCGPFAYTADKLHAPTLVKKGDVDIEGSYAPSGGSNFGFAYALTDNYAIRGSANFFQNITSDSDYLKQRSFELGIGRYNLLGEARPSAIWLSFMNAKSNVGGYEWSFEGGNSFSTITGDYWRLSLQSSVLTNELRETPDKVFTVNNALSLRVSYINFFHYHRTTFDKLSIEKDDASSKLLSIDFATILKIGVRPFFIELVMGLADPMIMNKDHFDYFNPFIFSIGASLSFY